MMKYIRALAQHCIDSGRFLTWTSPTGFPIENSYCEEHDVITVNLKRGEVRIRHDILPDGCTDKVKLPKALDSAAPNFIHSLDAAHLVRTVNAAVAEGITDILTVHDSFYCLAPQATRFRDIILEQLAELYRDDPLAELRRRNVGDPDILPLPEYGLLVRWLDNSWSHRILIPSSTVLGSKHAFG